MSLIQEALQKANRQKETAPAQPASKPQNYFRIIENEEELAARLKDPPAAPLKIKTILAGILIFVAAFFGVQSLMTMTSKITLPKNTAKPSAGFSKGFVLTGITGMNEEQYAVINDQIVRVGEKVDGGVVEEIQSKEVVLNLRGKKIKLQL
ncbi:MAG: hypothetical protein HYZ83_03060 [Candidatus Omnitrophica bacterium]|nr:hypothetical protein [Candidatus Omnitrophota bacterium]